MRKLTIEFDSDQPIVGDVIFERQRMSNGLDRIFLRAPEGHPNLFRRLSRLMPAPLFVLYILHTPRSDADEGRYQSPPLSADEVDEFLERYQSYLADDGRHDIWLYSPEQRQTVVWDRHNQFFVEGPQIDLFVEALEEMGFHEGSVEPLGEHVHQFRAEFDGDAADILDAFDWFKTPLRPEDEQ